MYDTFWFEMAERPGSLLDITIRRSGEESFSKEDARCALNRMYHNVAEEARDSRLYCVIEVYEDSSTSVSWRGGDKPRLNSLRDYLWMRRRMEEAIHGKFSRYNLLPRWIINLNTVLLFVMIRIMQIVDAVFDLHRDDWLYQKQTVLGGAGEHVEVSDEDLDLSENVIPLFGSGPEDAA